MFRARLLKSMTFHQSLRYLDAPTFDDLVLLLEPIKTISSNKSTDPKILDEHKVLIGAARLTDRLVGNIGKIQEEGRIPVRRLTNLTEMRNETTSARRDRLYAEGGILVTPEHVAFSMKDGIAAKAVGFDPEKIIIQHAKAYIQNPFELFDPVYDRMFGNNALVVMPEPYVLTKEEALANAPKENDKPDLSRLFDAKSKPPSRDATLDADALNYFRTTPEAQSALLRILEAVKDGVSVDDVIREVAKTGLSGPKPPKLGGPSEP